MTAARIITMSFRGLICFVPFLLVSSGAEIMPEVKTHTVEIVRMKFKPSKLLVSKGDKIVFVNKDMVAHNVTEISQKRWKSPEIPPGKSWAMAATESAEYYCTLHPVMKGEITVSP